ncbi:MAG: restriction endonuclease [Planctomycetaceae bacterium]|nr:MAG: restriction endonuclease [Planctomycetaceae bacterium]
MVTEGATALQAHVLTLNRGYVAFQVITARRAFCLLIKGFAEVINVEEGHYRSYDFQDWQDVSELKLAFGERGADEDWINAVNFSIEVPRVIRLLRYDRVPQHVVKFNRRNIFLRDHNRCQYCRRRFSSAELSLDHVVPRSRGGRTTWDNIVSACLKCNVVKGGRTPREAGGGTCHPPTQTHPQPPAGRDRQLTEIRYVEDVCRGI